MASWIGSTIDGSPFSGLLTRVEIGHIRMRPAGNGRIRSRGDALRRELAEARAELYRLKILVAADRDEKQEVARQRMIVEASCAVRDLVA